jgi:hypothetical protein
MTTIDRVSALEAEVRELRQLVSAMRADAIQGCEERTSRRDLLRRAGAAAVGGVGAALILPRSASAANGDPVILGSVNSGSSMTTVAATSSWTASNSVVFRAEATPVFAAGVNVSGMEGIGKNGGAGVQATGGTVSDIGSGGGHGVTASGGRGGTGGSGVWAAGGAAATTIQVPGPGGTFTGGSASESAGNKPGGVGVRAFGGGGAGTGAGGDAMFGTGAGTANAEQPAGVGGRFHGGSGLDNDVHGAQGVVSLAGHGNGNGHGGDGALVEGGDGQAGGHGIRVKGGTGGAVGGDGVWAVGGASSGGADGRGVRAFGGGLTGAPLHLSPNGEAPPTTKLHQVGDVWMTTAGVMFLCTVAGDPGTWARVPQVQPSFFNGTQSNTGGAINLLPQPIRIHDSRQGGGSRLPAGETIDLDVTGVPINGIQVPLGAVGVLGTVTVTQTQGNLGFVTLYPAGVTPSTNPPTSNINWFAPGQTLATSFICGVDAAGHLIVHNGIVAGSNPTHVIIDIAAFIL